MVSLSKLMLKEAAAIAEMIVPYRHPRLKAITLAGDPNSLLRIRDDASADEMRVEIMKRLKILVSAGLIDLTALRLPDDGISASADTPASIERDHGEVTRTGSF
jgi:hypothetical protein